MLPYQHSAILSSSRRGAPPFRSRPPRRADPLFSPGALSADAEEHVRPAPQACRASLSSGKAKAAAAIAPAGAEGAARSPLAPPSEPSHYGRGGTPLPNEKHPSPKRWLKMTTTAPAVRPANARFSSGPCAKRPGWTPTVLRDAALGRSHRAKLPKAKLKLALDLTREVLGVPADYRIRHHPGVRHRRI